MDQKRPDVLPYATPPAPKPLMDPWVVVCLAASLVVSPAILGPWLMVGIAYILFGAFGQWTNMAGALALPAICLVVSTALLMRARRRGGSELTMFLALLAMVVSALSVLYYPVF